MINFLFDYLDPDVVDRNHLEERKKKLQKKINKLMIQNEIMRYAETGK